MQFEKSNERNNNETSGVQKRDSLRRLLDLYKIAKNDPLRESSRSSTVSKWAGMFRNKPIERSATANTALNIENEDEVFSLDDQVDASALPGTSS